MLLVRGEDGEVRAFANSCRHRGHELLPCGQSAREKAIVCPYHAWTYSLSGSLQGAAGFRKVRGFDFGEWGLAPLPVAEWHGLVFVDGSGGAAGSLTEALAKLDELVAPYEPERLVTAGEHRYDAAANWKTLTENYHECYHCPSIHPELCRVSPPKSGENYAADGAWIGGWMDLRDGMETMSLSGSSGGVPLRGLDAHGLRTVIYVNIFPNVLLSLHPDYVMTHRLIPVAADRTTIECTWAFAPEAVAQARLRPGLRGGVLGHHQQAGLVRVRVGAAGPGLAARLPGAAVPRRGRGVLLRHCHRPGLPRAVRLEPGTVNTVTIFDIPVKTLDGEDSSLGATAPGAALLVVNVASQCGLTPQYTALEKLHEQFASRGLTVVGFPCNQFGGQEPGTAEEIAEFCSTSYGVTFPMFEKIEVNGPGRNAIYDVLTATPDANGEAGDIQWNFEKFLVRPDGTVAARFRPRTEPDSPEVLAAIEENLPADYYLG